MGPTIAGQTCQVIVDTINGESVHAENYVTVEGGVPTITVTGNAVTILPGLPVPPITKTLTGPTERWIPE